MAARTIRGDAGASKQSSSANSLKSATRQRIPGLWFSSPFSAGDVEVLPEFFAQRGYALQRLFQARFIPRHAALLPEQLAQFAMERGSRRLPLIESNRFVEGLDIGLDLLEFRMAGGGLRLLGPFEVVANCVGSTK